MDLSRRLQLTALVFFLITLLFHTSYTRYHGKRHKRQRGANMYLPESSVVPGGEGDPREWSDWSSPSECSRSCGGGVSYQTRECLRYAPNGEPLCSGGSRKFYSCNTQDCPEEEADFRSQQCSRYDNIPFEGVRYEWIPYTKAPNPCELNCMPRGERFYYRHKAKVIDGTRCNDESLDVCVDGKCESVGCDMMLGSPAREDKCRKCAGDGQSCRTVSGLLDMNNLQVGYNDILLIPSSATNIEINEIAPSNNYLACRNLSGHYYLNGNWRIDFPRPMAFAGSWWHYDRKPQGFAAPDHISCIGPTTESIYLVLLYQDRNVGIEYEYSIPENAVKNEPDTYSWTHSGFGPCSASCGGGYQTRDVMCNSRTTLELVDDGLCDATAKPSDTQQCGQEECTPQWTEGPWDKCSKPCGQDGIQHRTVHCERISRNGNPEKIDDAICYEMAGNKPADKQECNRDTENCPKYHIAPWQPCDKLCGEGTQKRKVTCFKEENGKKTILSDSECSEEKPEAEQKCILQPCEGVDWITSAWSGCKACGQSQETRTAICGTKKGISFDEKFCSEEKPELVRDCKEQKKCEYQWFSSEWSKCSATCGKGVQSRTVICGQFDGTSVTPAKDDSKCSADAKPEISQDCEIKEDDCPGQWFTGPWEECDKKCGGGSRTREVICLLNGEVSVTCDEELLEFSSEECNTQPCTEDETLPVDATSKPVEEDEEDECEDEGSEEDMFDAVTDKQKADIKVSDGIDLDGETTSESSLLTDELMMSDSTGFETESTGSSDGSTDIPETTIEGSGETIISLSTEGSGDDDTTDSSDITESSTDSSDITERSDSTDSSETTDASASTGSSEATDSSLSTGVSGSTDVSSSTDASASTDVSGSTDASDSTDTSGSTASDTSSASTQSGSTDESEATETSISSESTDVTNTSEKSSEVTESTSDNSDSSSAVTGESDSSSTDSTDITTASESSESTSSDASETTDTTQSESTDSTVSEDTSPSDTTSSESTISTELSSESSSTETSTDGSSTTDDSSTIDSSSTLDGSSTTEGSSTTDLSSSSDGSTDSSVSTDSKTSDLTSEGSTDISGKTTDLGSTETSASTETSETEGTDTTETSGSTDSSDSTESPASSESTEISGSTDVPESTEASSSSEKSESSTILSSSEETGSTDIPLSTETSGSTEATESTVSISSSSEETTMSSDTQETSGTGDTETTQSGSTAESGSTESTVEVSTTSGSEETTIDIWSSTSSDITDETVSGSTPYTLEDIITKEQTTRKCKPKKDKIGCSKSKYGCCPDNTTTAKGPFDKGCPIAETCKETKFGCCSDGLSPAKGKKNQGCPKSQCAESLFGCCPDKYTPAEGEDNEGCPEPTTTEAPTTTPQPTTAASTESKEEAAKTEEPQKSCSFSEHGCCPDKKTESKGPNFEGCDIVDEEDCTNSLYGCCPDNKSSATGPNREGCDACSTSQFGCCQDRHSPAHGPNYEGCCLDTQFGCCPDNINAARGPNNEGCNCEYSPYGCCPDKQTAARGYNNDGCGCQYTQFGCCPDKLTPAGGDKFEGCPCHTMQFGCCPDGITIPQGPHHYGCHCSQTEHKCCADEKTAAKGPNMEGCTCAEGKYGCCPDGVTESQGKKFEGCENITEAPQKACALPKETGPCNNFTIRHFFDISYGACARFWYGGCEGNGNNFETADDCKATCEEYKGKESCLLPSSSGPCPGSNKRWYFDSDRNQCQEFNYGGCFGNTNRFESIEECQSTCSVDENLPPCEQPMDAGPCQGSFERWFYDNETDVCRPFVYGGCKGNKNNYMSEHGCTYHCKQPGVHKELCALSKEVGECEGRDARWHYSESDRKCMPFYYSGCGGNKNNFYTLEQCEERCPKQIAKDICEIPAEVGECQNYVARWYFDTKEVRCRQFYWGGCGGNENNFGEESDCLNRCEKKPEPEPEPERRPEPESRPGVSETPDSRPVEEDSRVCFLPADSGPCRTIEARYYYNSVEGICDRFAYGGCEGNGNNFKTEPDCENSCFHVQNTCSLPPLRGRCEDNTTRWYFDERSARCYEFEFSGCSGNRNNFFTERECLEFCDRTPPEEEKVIPDVGVRVEDEYEFCREPLQGGNCAEQILSWYFNSERNSCEAFYYTGCDGNRNRFETQEQCERQCGEYRGTDICNEPMEVGPCDQWQTRFYYNVQRRQCEAFTYGGCSGSGNRFTSLPECESVCIAHQEPSPEHDKAICYLPVHSGHCKEEKSEETKRWYYDDERGTCIPFIYSGCSGNQNNFRSYVSCINYCTNVEQPEPEVVPEYHEPEEDRCATLREQCEKIRCPYGVRHFADPSGCDQCECESPCDHERCPEGSSCAVDISGRDFIAVCREINKPGECPRLSNGSRCERECYNDADCRGDNKCCYDGCADVCVHPAVPDVYQPPTEAPILYPGDIPVTLQIKPKHEIDVDTPAGGVAILRCFATGYPAPTIIWRFGSIQINTNQGRFVLTPTGDLTIVQVHRADSGTYVCIADNGLGRPVQREIDLQVSAESPIDAYIVGSKNYTKIVTLNQPTSLRCPAGGNPKPVVTWWRGKDRLPYTADRFEVNRDFSLAFRNVVIQDLGPYTCEAYAGRGRPVSVQITMKAIGPVHTVDPLDQPHLQYIIEPTRPPVVRPQYPYRPTRPAYGPPPPDVYRPTYTTQRPQVRQVPAHASIKRDPVNTYIVNSDVSLTCEIDGIPIPNVTWSKDGNQLEPSDKIQIIENPHRLILYNVQQEDSGMYGCTARNHFSDSTHEEHVTIESNVYIHPDCVDNPYFANCALIVKGNYCSNRYYGKFCCRSCTLAGQMSGAHPNALK